MSSKLEIAKEQIKCSIERGTIRIFEHSNGTVSCFAHDNPISFGPFKNIDILINVFAHTLMSQLAKNEFNHRSDHLQYIRNRFEQTKELIEIGNTLFELFNHFNVDPFENGNTAYGRDEGTVLGWKFVDELKFKWENIIKNME